MYATVQKFFYSFFKEINYFIQQRWIELISNKSGSLKPSIYQKNAETLPWFPQNIKQHNVSILL